MKMQLCMIAQLKNEHFFSFSPFEMLIAESGREEAAEDVNRMHPVEENVFIINYVAFFLSLLLFRYKWICLFI